MERNQLARLDACFGPKMTDIIHEEKTALRIKTLFQIGDVAKCSFPYQGIAAVRHYEQARSVGTRNTLNPKQAIAIIVYVSLRF